MKIYNTSGTFGDTFVNCCKLYDVTEDVKLLHYTKYANFNSKIKELYNLVPNITEVQFCRKSKKIDYAGPIKLHFCNPDYPRIFSLPKSFPEEPSEIKMNFFPDFKFESNFSYDFPYIVLQPKSGRKEQKKEYRIETIKRIIQKSKYKVVLLGTSKKFEKVGNCINLTNKTTLSDAFSLIKNSKYFIGFFGIMTMVALSSNVKCNFIYTTETELDYRVRGTPWEKLCKHHIILNDYLKIEGSSFYKIRVYLNDIMKSFYKVKPIKRIAQLFLTREFFIRIYNGLFKVT